MYKQQNKLIQKKVRVTDTVSLMQWQCPQGGSISLGLSISRSRKKKVAFM